ncbi:MAG TPA: hypothetical protein ENN98_08080, partial [Desulfurivibrio alkaliphilus]|nr:hypothetical protein [Desulfurivibrio alkaliphilus]
MVDQHLFGGQQGLRRHRRQDDADKDCNSSHNFRNRSAAPHLRAISQAYVHGVRGAWPLARTCGTA